MHFVSYVTLRNLNAIGWQLHLEEDNGVLPMRQMNYVTFAWACSAFTLTVRNLSSWRRFVSWKCLLKLGCFFCAGLLTAPQSLPEQRELCGFTARGADWNRGKAILHSCKRTTLSVLFCTTSTQLQWTRRAESLGTNWGSLLSRHLPRAPQKLLDVVGLLMTARTAIRRHSHSASYDFTSRTLCVYPNCF